MFNPFMVGVCMARSILGALLEGNEHAEEIAREWIAEYDRNEGARRAAAERTAS